MRVSSDSMDLYLDSMGYYWESLRGCYSMADNNSAINYIYMTQLRIALPISIGCFLLVSSSHHDRPIHYYYYSHVRTLGSRHRWVQELLAPRTRKDRVLNPPHPHLGQKRLRQNSKRTIMQTIIEVLKYITTGALPPSSDKGKNFVMDPKMIGQT